MKKIRLVFISLLLQLVCQNVFAEGILMDVKPKDLTLTIADRSILTATTHNLSAGRYVVRYRVVTKDGLVVSGITRFEIKA